MFSIFQFSNLLFTDLETPDSILTQVNIRTLLNKSTFLKLPPEYQYKLMGLLPQVDRLNGKLRHSSLNNEFFAKACQEWKERLCNSDFTPENMAKARADVEKDKQKTDPWKVQHFEPVWGIKKDFTFVDSEDEALVKKVFKKKRKTTEIIEPEKLLDENEPLLKKVKAKDNSPEKVKLEPSLILDDSPNEIIDGTEEVVEEETVIEEPVNILEEPEPLSDPPLRSYSIDEDISIPSPTIATPSVTPPVVITPASTPIPCSSTSVNLSIEPIPVSTPSSDIGKPSSELVISTASVNSPASVRSTRGNSITFSSSRSPSPAYSNPLSMASIDDTETESVKSDKVLDIDPSILPKTFKPKTNINPQRQNPTAIVNKSRPPKGDVNLERSMEIVRSAVEKSSTAMQQPQPPQPMVIPVRPPPVSVSRPSMSNAVLVQTSDGKTLLAHPLQPQNMQNIRPTVTQVSPSPLRVRLPSKPTQVPTSQPQVRQVCVVQQGPRPTTVFRMPTSSASSGATVVLDTNQLNTLIVSIFIK